MIGVLFDTIAEQGPRGDNARSDSRRKSPEHGSSSPREHLITTISLASHMVLTAGNEVPAYPVQALKAVLTS